MNIEIKVGQVWRHVDTKNDWKVIFVDRYWGKFTGTEDTFTDSLRKFDKGVHSLVSDSPLSNLEIVQKALQKENCFVEIIGVGAWHLFERTSGEYIGLSGDSLKGLLTWAKQTIGDEVLFDGTMWKNRANCHPVLSVNGQTGPVVLVEKAR